MKKQPPMVRRERFGDRIAHHTKGGYSHGEERTEPQRTFDVEMPVPHRICAQIPQEGDIRANKGGYRKLCEEKKVEIIEAEASSDHIHMLVSIPPHLSVSQFMGYLKGKSTLMIFDRHANLKYKYGSRHFWCRGYYVDTVGRNKKVIAEYIRNQLVEDEMMDQMTIKGYVDPFTGSKNKKA